MGVNAASSATFAVQIRHGPERLHQVIRQIKLVQLTVMVQTQARLKTIHRQAAVGHNSPPLGREGLPFFFFHRGIIAKDIDLIFLNFLYYAKRQTFKAPSWVSILIPPFDISPPL